MTKLILSSNVTLDGYNEDLTGDFNFAEPDDEVHSFWNDIVRDTGAELMGRRLYEMMEPYWSDLAAKPSGEPITDEFAKQWVATPRYVASRTLESAEHGVELLGPDLESEVERIKGEVDGDIDVGGPSLGNSLAELGLIDQIRMVVNPYVLGAGKPFLGPAFSKSKWKLIEQRSFKASILFHYEKA